MTGLLVATRSGHKVNEIRAILADEPVDLRSLAEAGLQPTPEEDGLEPFETFEENALSKARHFHRRSGLPTLADDSGLCVDALDGAPGVRSKRFAPLGGLAGTERDRANNEHLLALLEGTPGARRAARYVCVAVLVGLGAEPVVVRGEAAGTIAETPAGSGGFGYDPLFFDPSLGRTFGQLTAAEKHARSHRGKAFRELAVALRYLAAAG